MRPVLVVGKEAEEGGSSLVRVEKAVSWDSVAYIQPGGNFGFELMLDGAGC